MNPSEFALGLHFKVVTLKEVVSVRYFGTLPGEERYDQVPHNASLFPITWPENVGSSLIADHDCSGIRRLLRKYAPPIMPRICQDLHHLHTREWRVFWG